MVDEQGIIAGVTVVDMCRVGAQGWFAVFRELKLVIGKRCADGVSRGQFVHRAGF